MTYEVHRTYPKACAGWPRLRASYITIPPSTASTCPVTYRAAGLAR